MASWDLLSWSTNFLRSGQEELRWSACVPSAQKRRKPEDCSFREKINIPPPDGDECIRHPQTTVLSGTFMPLRRVLDTIHL